MELASLGSALGLTILGIITPVEMLEGFSNPTVITIVSLFVIGSALFETGVASNLAGKLIGLARGNDRLFLLTIVLLTAFLSGFLSNTGTVAVMIPTVIAAAKKLKKPVSLFLLPMAFSASIGGMLTLIGTPPNIVVSTALGSKGLEPFSFFEFSYLGVPVLLIYLVYLYFAADRSKQLVEPKGKNADQLSEQLTQIYNIPEEIFRLRVRAGSELIGKSLSDEELSEFLKVNILAVDRKSKHHKKSKQEDLKRPLCEDDVLLAVGDVKLIQDMVVELQLGIQTLQSENLTDSENSLLAEIGIAEAIIPQRSNLNQQSIKKIGFYERYKVRVLGIMRNGVNLSSDFINTPLQFGDQLFLLGPWSEINQLNKDNKNFIVYGRPERLRELDKTPLNLNSWLSILGLTVMVVLMLFNILPMVVISVLVAFSMILLKCVKIEDAYKAINWQSVILIASMIPMSTALNKTGGGQLIVNWMVGYLGGSGPLVVLCGIFVLTSVFSQFISNTATAILVAPIAIKTADVLNVSPYPFLIIVAAAASAAFLTPVASPVNTLVLGPGGYSFKDFMKKGFPLLLLVMLTSMVLVPLIWPL